MALKDIVDVQITRAIATITRVGFGTVAFVFDAPAAPGARILEFSSADEVDVSTALTATAKLALSMAFSGDVRPDRVKAIYRLAGQSNPANNETYVAALAAAAAVDEDWYGVTIQSKAADDILAVAGWVEARDKIFIAATADAGVLDPLEDEDIASQILAMSYARTGLIYAGSAVTTFPDVAWAGPLLPLDPGSITWAFQRIAGTAGRAFTGAEITALTNKRVSRLETVQGLTRVIGGYVSDPGAFIDTIHGLDWLKQRMAEDIFVRLASSPKIPFTNAGIASIENVIRNRLSDAVDAGVIADDENLSVHVPKVADTDENDRGTRLLRGVTFTARLAGAIHKVIVRGTATV